MIGGVSAAGGAALRAAAGVGDAPACSRLLGHARCVRFSRDELGRSALHLSASGGHVAVVRLLLAAAAPREIDSPDGAGCTALQRAAADGHEDVVKLLISRGADVNKQDSVHGNSALHEASWKGYSRTVSILVNSSCNLSQMNAGGFTALHLCCQNGHNQSCRELLLGGCDPDIQNNYGDTSLHTAARYGHAGVTRILISAQCRVSEQNKNGDTALHIAAAMGRRKLTRILLEAGCDKSVRNKQHETAEDIALRKDLHEIVNILDQQQLASEKMKKDRKKIKKRSKSKVRFDSTKKNESKDDVDLEKSKHWSPYGCHYYPDPEAFPAPRLDSLPSEPLKRGEQYYLDLAGNIRKGPVGVGYTCYCAPLFRHLEARMEKDKRELQKAQMRLGQRVAGLEQKISRGMHGRRSERIHSMREQQQTSLPRSRSLEMLDGNCKIPLHTARSMDELENQQQQQQQQEPRKTVKELIAQIQKKEAASSKTAENSESSDDEEDPPLQQHPTQPSYQCGTSLNQSSNHHHHPQHHSIATNPPSYENVPSMDAPPRSRSGLYSPTTMASLVDSKMRYIEPVVRVQEYDVRRYNEVSARFAKLRTLDNNNTKSNALEGSSRLLDSNKMFESTTRMLDNPQDNVDRDTNNDSGYSTKVYGSSKGNSPSLSGLDNDCLGASSLV
nr:ankyrin repeat domain-containing protein 6 [Onthophagus taurus]